jgi:hypothetical protein
LPAVRRWLLDADVSMDVKIRQIINAVVVIVVVICVLQVFGVLGPLQNTRIR